MYSIIEFIAVVCILVGTLVNISTKNSNKMFTFCCWFIGNSILSLYALKINDSILLMFSTINVMVALISAYTHSR